ncbi:MAG: tail protein X [Enterocloster bolteae]
MNKTYTTINGQTWDQIAYEVYGDEHYCDRIMDANRDKLEFFCISVRHRVESA